MWKNVSTLAEGSLGGFTWLLQWTQAQHQHKAHVALPVDLCIFVELKFSQNSRQNLTHTRVHIQNHVCHFFKSLLPLEPPSLKDYEKYLWSLRRKHLYFLYLSNTLIYEEETPLKSEMMPHGEKRKKSVKICIQMFSEDVFTGCQTHDLVMWCFSALTWSISNGQPLAKASGISYFIGSSSWSSEFH